MHSTTNTNKLCLSVFTLFLPVKNRQNTTICFSDYEYSSQTMLAVFLHHSVKDFTPFTLFNLALLFKLYFSFRESYDLILI